MFNSSGVGIYLAKNAPKITNWSIQFLVIYIRSIIMQYLYQIPEGFNVNRPGCKPRFMCTRMIQQPRSGWIYFWLDGKWMC